MDSKNNILAQIRKNQPKSVDLPDVKDLGQYNFDPMENFEQMLQAVGSKVYHLKSEEELPQWVKAHFPDARKIVSPITALSSIAEVDYENKDPHELKEVDLAVLPALFAVAENGAVWLTEKEIKQRVLPFICQDFVVVIPEGKIFSNMHLAYEEIGSKDYGFGTFISGPSKTADIEQSLVVGAHGPKSMTVVFVDY